MNTNKKYSVLYIKEENSFLDSDTKIFNQLFSRIDKVFNTQESLNHFDSNKYDIIIGDLTLNPDNSIILLKKIRDKQPEQTIFALLSPKDSDKLYKIANLNIHAFELTPTQFNQALEEIARFSS